VGISAGAPMSRWYTLHIKNEILFWFLLLSLLPLLGLSGANYWYQKTLYEAQAQEHLQLILDQKTDAIGEHLQRVEEEMELLALSPDVRAIFERGSLKPDEERRVRAVVGKYRFHDLFLIETEGEIVYSVQKEDDFGSNLFRGPYSMTNLGRVYRNTLDHLETQISDFEYYSPSRKEALFIATPIFGEGRMIGVLAIQHDIDKIHELFSDSHGLGNSGELFAAKRGEGGTIVSTTPLKYNQTSSAEPFVFAGDPGLPIRLAVSGSRGKGEGNDYRGEKVIAAWSYIPTLRWGIVAKIDRNEILRPIDELRFYSILLLFFVGLGIVIAILSAIKHIVHPIEKLSLSVRNFAQEKSPPALELDSENEIGDLARSFHDMTLSLRSSQETIQKYAGELEEKVRLRTRELELAKERIEVSNTEMKRYIDIIDSYVITSTTDLKGTITQASRAFCEITGYTREELIGKKHNIIRHPDMADSLYDTLWKTIKSGRIWNGEIKNLRKDGSFYWVDSTITPIFDEEGKIKEYTSIRQDITDKKRIEEISITDGLTGIYNRRHFNDIFPKRIQAARRKGETLCFVMMDVDHFKLYNDHYGHQKGDEVLKEVGRILKESCKRGDDYPFRLGGEEFGIVFGSESAEKGAEFAEKIRESVQSLAIVHEFGTPSGTVSVSIGLTCAHGSELGSMDEIYKYADELLYEAKHNGRNRVVADPHCKMRS
jgi:diguanylate cyclase (GGDEF)-like protein/PAS domain S-box-containing protein